MLSPFRFVQMEGQECFVFATQDRKAFRPLEASMMTDTSHQSSPVRGHRYVSAVPVCPGEILRRELLEGLDMSQQSLARAISVVADAQSENIR